MATYKSDLTQPLPVATPDYSAAARAIETRGKADIAALSTIADIGSKVYSAYRQEDIKSTTDKGETAEQLAESFLTSNMVAEAAQGKMMEVSALAKKEQGTLLEAGMADMYGYEAGSEDVAAKARANLQGYSNALMSLKKASEGGMPNTEYATRVASIAKNAIAKYPYMADEIRKAVGDITGLVGADQFAIRQFVASRFSRTGTGGGAGTKGVKSPEALLQDEQDFIGKTLGISTLDVSKVYANDPKEYRRLKQQATTRSTLAAGLQANENEIKNYAARGELEGLKNSGVYANSVRIYAQQKNIENRTSDVLAEFKNMAVQIRTGAIKDFSARALQREASLFSNVQLQSIEEGRQLALQKLREDQRQFQYSDERYKELERQINEEAKSLNKIYAGEASFMGYIATLAKNEEATEDQLNKGMETAQGLARDFGVTSSVVQAALSGDPAKQKNIKDQYPQLYNVVMNYVKTADSYEGQRALLGVQRGLSIIQERLHRARYGVVDIYEGLTDENDSMSIEEQKERKEADQAAAQAVHSQASDDLKSSEQLTTAQKNTITVATAQQQIDGNNAALLRSDFTKTKEMIDQKFTGPDFIALRDKVAQANIASVQRIADAKAMYERQYGAVINLTTLPDGTLQVAAPTKPAMIRRNENPTSPLTPEGAQYLRDMQAFRQFQKSYGNTLITSVFGAALVTDKRPFEHAQNIANVINNNLPYEFMPQAGAGRGEQEPVVTPVRQEQAQPSQPISPLGQALERGFEGLATAGNAAVNAVGNALSNYAERQDRVMTEAVNTVAQRKTQQIQDVVGATSKVSKSALDNVSEVREKGIEYLSEEGAKFLNGIKKQVGTIVEAISNVSVSEPPVNITDGFPLPEGYVPGGTGDTMAAIAKPYVYQGKPFRAWVKPNQELTPQNVMIHHTATDNVRQVINGFSARFKGQDETYGTGAHYLISKKGEVISLVDKDTDIVYHVGDAQYPQYKEVVTNNNTIGIEMVGADSNNFTEAQIQAARKLVSQLMTNHGKLNIYSHGEVSQNKLPSEGLELTQQLRKEFNQ